MYSKRSAGKLVFYDVKADGEKVQVMADVATSGGDLAAFVALHNSVKVRRGAGAGTAPAPRMHADMRCEGGRRTIYPRPHCIDEGGAVSWVCKCW